MSAGTITLTNGSAIVGVSGTHSQLNLLQVTSLSLLWAAFRIRCPLNR